MTIGAEYFMPVVRDVPVFPEGELRPGDTWTAPGHEVHDFREPFGVTLPWRVPFTARYRYLGTREWRGREYPAFSVSYEIDHAVPVPRNRVQPRRIRGSSEEIVYWDREIGQARYYTEVFNMNLELSNGYTMEFRGNAEAELLESENMNRESLAEEIAGELSGIEGAAVEASEAGVTIVLEDIRFGADSAELLPGEQEKLDRIADILRRYGDRDLLVEGHTALAGNAESRERLSLERAGAVADYLVGQGVRSRERVLLRGHGADRPRAGNDTEAGRRRNRRVEITILEN
jgi:outer membrane protein OmpA-like peptidoglycan-associated protein